MRASQVTRHQEQDNKHGRNKTTRQCRCRPHSPGWKENLTSMVLHMAALILTTQRRADRLASLREQMTLQLAILSEQKAAKVIALVEELRRDSPEIRERIDSEAQAMATHANPEAVSQAIKEIQPAERRTIPGPEIDGARTVHTKE